MYSKKKIILSNDFILHILSLEEKLGSGFPVEICYAAIYDVKF